MPRERIRRHGQNDNPKKERKGICKDAYVFFRVPGMVLNRRSYRKSHIKVGVLFPVHNFM